MAPHGFALVCLVTIASCGYRRDQLVRSKMVEANFRTKTLVHQRRVSTPYAPAYH